MKLIFREDDVNKDTDVAVLKYIHEQFLDNHLTHTVSFLCDGLEKNTKLIDYINSTTNWDLAIHGWNHHNYCVMSKSQIEDELDKCILQIDRLFNVVPEKWYLPFNGWVKDIGFKKVPFVSDIAFFHGVDVDIDCYHISDAVPALEKGEKLNARTVYFHGWDVEDLKLLPNLLYLSQITHSKLASK
jgi:peptidoglycan/xylan/chitin deacetylase (PgdA/CDA1 family)